MRPKLVARLVTVLGVTILLTACDNFADYTVANETGEELLTWPLLEQCSVVVGNKEDYLHEELVKPRERFDYSEVYSPWLPEPKCVQVTTTDRRLVLAEEYEYMGTYTVREPIQPLSEPIPERDDLPSQSWGEFFRETPPAFFVVMPIVMVLGLGFFAAFVFVAFITVRFFYLYYVRKT